MSKGIDKGGKTLRVLLLGALLAIGVLLFATYRQVRANRLLWANYWEPIAVTAVSSTGVPSKVMLTSSRIAPKESSLQQWWWEWSEAAKQVVTGSGN